MMSESGPGPRERIAFAFRLATGRLPNDAEHIALRELFEAQKQEYQSDEEQALALLGVGESQRDESLDAVELAAWTTVASIILNLDETITKN